MKKFETLLLVAMVLTAVTAVAVAGAQDSVSSATDVITGYSKNKVTRDAVKTELSNKYVSGTFTKADLKKVITAAYNHNLLKRARQES